MEKELLIKKLNAKTREERIDSLIKLKKLLGNGYIKKPVREGYTNNHVHTKYSFSPYSPAKAVWTAYMSGLDVVGIIDHDAINGAYEFKEAGEILGIATTTGFEMRTDWRKTGLNGRKINNPDQVSNAYISAHGLPHNKIEKADRYLSVIRDARQKRNREILKKLNGIMEPEGMSIDYDRDIIPLSYSPDGGTVTERHLLFAATLKLIRKLGKGNKLIGFIEKELHIGLTQKQCALLSDENNGDYEYDLLNILKGRFLEQIYIKTCLDETPPVDKAVDFIRKAGAIPTYCYLGDVEASPTGDKKPQKFEDGYLEELFEECRDIGFQAIAFMPSRNTVNQLKRVMELCRKFNFMQISGEDINQPGQSFICKELIKPEFKHLMDSAWALVGHEYMAGMDLSKGIFANKQQDVDMDRLIYRYKKTGE